MLGDAGGVGKQPIDGDKGRERGKNREDAVVGHACGQRENAVVAYVAVDAPEDVLPSLRRDI